MGQFTAAFRRPESIVEVFPSLGVAAHALLQQLQIAHDDGEQVVEIVRDAAGELAHGLHLLRLAELLLDAARITGKGIAVWGRAGGPRDDALPPHCLALFSGRGRRVHGDVLGQPGALRGVSAVSVQKRRLPDNQVASGQGALEKALEPGEAPDWAEAAAYIDALILEEIEDDLLEQCGVNPAQDPRETWLGTVKARLRDDLGRLREDIEGNHDEIEEWDFRDGRIFASIGSFEDESDPDSGHGWLCRLLDAGALAAAGFQRVRKAQLLP